MTQWLGGPEIWIKHDDLTGMGLGGNKVRKLEFLAPDVRAQSADTLVTTGYAQSNHARLTAAMASRMGLQAVLVLNRIGHAEDQGNVLLDRLLGAEIRWVEPGEDTEAAIQETLSDLRRRGRRPYNIAMGGSNGLGACGYVVAAHELHQQAVQLGFAFDVVVCAAGSGGTFGGLLLGQRLFDLPFKVWAVSVGPSAEVLRARTMRVLNEGCELLELPPFDGQDLVVFDEFIGPGYSIVSPEARDAIRVLARLEGVFLDPVYTSKAMAGLFALSRRGALTPGQRVAFLHTGGAPGLFAYDTELIGEPVTA